MTASLDPTPILAMQGPQSTVAFAAQLGVSRKQIHRWRAGENGIRHHTADKVAISLGYHPVELWPEWLTT